MSSDYPPNNTLDHCCVGVYTSPLWCQSHEDIIGGRKAEGFTPLYIFVSGRLFAHPAYRIDEFTPQIVVVNPQSRFFVAVPQKRKPNKLRVS
jgi:hypothetical protein